MTDALAESPIVVDAPRQSQMSGRRLSTGTQVYLYTAMIIIAAIVIIPLLTTALGGFKTLGDLRRNAFGLPETWMWSNYWDILTGVRYWRQMGNSLLIAVLTVVLTLSFSSMAAFVFAQAWDMALAIPGTLRYEVSAAENSLTSTQPGGGIY